MKPIRGFYFITDSSLSRAGNASDVSQAIAAGVSIVQYRQKNASTKQMHADAAVLKPLCGKALFIINDRIDIALAVEADGIHIGQDDLPLVKARALLGVKRVIGVTVHDFIQAQEAHESGADYIAVAPVFPTSTKSDAGAAVGVELIKHIHSHIPIPIVAIGGITLANASEVIEAGADALCAISAVVTKDNVPAEIKKFQALFARF